ncbi:hypothetical protein B0J15DRAFT_380554, partial [Fusarium solani]
DPPPQNAYALAFRLPYRSFPNASDPTKLLQAIKSRTVKRPTLDERFAIAKSLAKTVFGLHSVDWLHKSIRSENVLFVYQDSHRNYKSPFAVRFEFSRDERDRSMTEQDDCLGRNIYPHPDRQGQLEKRFNGLHDIYCIRVALLEIGLWRSSDGFE